MEDLNLEEVIRKMYDSRVEYIKDRNIKLEREYFSKNRYNIPVGEILADTSYEEQFEYYKEAIENGTDDEIEEIFELLEAYFLFSSGHDMMFKKKLEADIFLAPPIKSLIYPMLEEKVKESYNDVSVMRKNPNLDKNLKEIDKIVYTYMELQSLLYLLYCNDFQFGDGMEGLFPNIYEEIINTLDESNMTIGEFLHALVDHKCEMMSDVLSNINSTENKEKYLKELDTLQRKQHEETDTLTNVSLPITYFKSHTMLDFLEENITRSSILEDTSKKQKKKIIIR